MQASFILLQSIVYGICGLVITSYPALGTDAEAPRPAHEELRTEVKTSLAPSERAAQKAAREVGKAVAAEIMATGLNAEVLKHGLEAAAKPRKVLALKSEAGKASGQSDQT